MLSKCQKSLYIYPVAKKVCQMNCLAGFTKEVNQKELVLNDKKIKLLKNKSLLTIEFVFCHLSFFTLSCHVILKIKFRLEDLFKHSKQIFITCDVFPISNLLDLFHLTKILDSNHHFKSSFIITHVIQACCPGCFFNLFFKLLY